MDLEIRTKIKVTEQEIEDIFVGAIEGGISYWCKEIKMPTTIPAEVNQKESFSIRCSEIVQNGGEIYLMVDMDDDGFGESKRKLNMDRIKRGWSKYFNDWHSPVYGEDSSGDRDATHADVIFQFAVFGEIVFG